MADLQVLKKLLAEEYGITTARELDEAMKKIGGYPPIAQKVEHLTLNQGVARFNPCSADQP